MLAKTGHIVLPPIAPKNQKSLFKLHAIGFEDVKAAAPEISKAQEYLEMLFEESEITLVGWVTVGLYEKKGGVFLCCGFWEEGILEISLAFKNPGEDFDFQPESPPVFFGLEQEVMAWEIQCFAKYAGSDDLTAYINDVMQT